MSPQASYDLAQAFAHVQLESIVAVVIRMLQTAASCVHMLVQTHDQAVDPNLVRLAAAYEVAATQMTSTKAH